MRLHHSVLNEYIFSIKQIAYETQNRLNDNVFGKYI